MLSALFCSPNPPNLSFFMFLLPYCSYIFTLFSVLVMSSTLFCLLALSPLLSLAAVFNYFPIFLSLFFPYHYFFFKAVVIYVCFIHIFFIYSSRITFFQKETHVFLGLSLSVAAAHAINVSDCAILQRVKDMRRLSNRSIDSV